MESSERVQGAVSRQLSSKVAVLTMVRSIEFPAANAGLSTIRTNLDGRTHHFVLLNDARDPELEASLTSHPNTTVLTPGGNLGVACGRNALIEAALAWGAEYLISLDDDLVVPTDFAPRIIGRIQRFEAEGARPGIVGPAVLDFHAFAERAMTEEEAAAAESGEIIRHLSTGELRSRLEGWEEIPEEAVYHLGIRDWKRHYVSIQSGGADRLKHLLRTALDYRSGFEGPTELRHDPTVRRRLIDDDPSAVEVDVLPGGASAYSRTLLETIGAMDETFSPFGYEDSDFALRARAAGYQNYLLPGELLLHDLDRRGKTRDAMELLYVQGRSRALIARRHLDRRRFERALAEGLLLGPFFVRTMVRRVDGNSNAPIATYLAGLVSWINGWIRGVFIDDVAATHGLPDPSRRLVVSPADSIERRVDISSGPGVPQRGLPRAINTQILIDYQLDPDAGTFELQRLELDSPGIGRLQATGRLSNVSLGLEDGAGHVRLDHLQLRVRDEGMVRRLNTTLRSRRKERVRSYLDWFAPLDGGSAASTLRTFLAGNASGSWLEWSVRPRHPWSVSELLSLTPNRVKAASLLGLECGLGG